MGSGPGTNYFSILNDHVRIALTNEDNAAAFAECVGDPNVYANDTKKFLVGCIMRRSDITVGSNLFQNTGTYVTPSWSYLGGLIGSTSGIFSNPPPGATTETWLGSNAGDNGGSKDHTVFIGVNAGNGASFADNSVFIGSGSGQGATNANNGMFFGTQSGVNAINATNSMFLGQRSGYGATDAAFATFFGYQSGEGSLNGYESFFGGFQAGYGAINANNTIFIGYQSGLNDTVNNSSGPGWSIAIGRQTGTGGFGGSIALGQGAVNTMEHELYVADEVIHLNFAGVHYTFPTTQGAAGTKLTNDGSGNLTWS